MIINICVHSSDTSKLGTNTSPKVEATNGVKQGGVLSPILFSVYVDGLFHRLKKSGVGCQMSNYFIGCLLFADDITLLCPKKMVTICEEDATEFNVKCNVKKSKLLIFKGKQCKISIQKIKINGDTIHSSEIEDHLGHTTIVSNKDSKISAAIACFWKTFNLLLPVSGNPLTYSCLIVVVFIHLLSAIYVNNIVVDFMVQIYGFELIRYVIFVLHGEGL